MEEDQIIQRALNEFTERTGLRMDWEAQYDKDRSIDGIIDIHLPNGKVQLYTEIKKELRHYQLHRIFELAEQHKPFMIVAETIFPTLRELLREKEIGYMDLLGNIYLKIDDHYIWVEGHKRIEKKKAVTNRAFTKTGLKVVFYFLLKEDAINMPYRRLADVTGVALGNIKNVVEGLMDTGFILPINNRILKLQNKEALLDRWLAGFRETLQPFLHKGTYRFLDKDKIRNWRDLPLPAEDTQWGGEPAAELLTNYLVPARLTVYTNNKNELIRQWRLIPDENGHVRFYEKFWKDKRCDADEYVPPLLVYADLMLTDDPRCQETAMVIYDKYLKHEYR